MQRGGAAYEMKVRLFVLGLLLLGFSIFVNGQNAVLIKGSDTMLPFMRKIADTYSQKGKDTLVQVIGGGSLTGIEALRSNAVTMAMSSRMIKNSERLEFEKQGVTIKSVTVGIDALAIVVHPSNPIKRITRKQLEEIFSGKIKNWIDLGGENIPIELFIRDKTSGTYEFFKENVMQGVPYAPNANLVGNNNETIKEVSKYPGAIGYVGFYYVKNDKYPVKPLNVSYDDKPYVLPTKENAKNHNYPITRSLYIYYRSDRENEALPIIKYILSPEGQTNVSMLGYLPVAKFD